MKKENIKSFILISVMVIFALGTTYAYMNLTITSNAATGEGGCFEVAYEGTEINNSSLKSTTSYLEGAKSQITLSKDEDCLIYSEATIFMYTDSENTTAPLDDPQALKYKIMQGETLISEGIINDPTKDIELATVTLETVPTVYDVYIWIDSAISAGQYNGTKYNGYLYAKSTQKSTIIE